LHTLSLHDALPICLFSSGSSAILGFQFFLYLVFVRHRLFSSIAVIKAATYMGQPAQDSRAVFAWRTTPCLTEADTVYKNTVYPFRYGAHHAVSSVHPSVCPGRPPGTGTATRHVGHYRRNRGW